MAQQNTQFLVLFLAVLSLFSRYNALKDDRLNHYFEEDIGFGYYPRVYPSYYSAIEDHGKLDNSVMPSSFQRYPSCYRVTSSLDRSTVVNVDDFGATGDKVRDTEAFEKAWMKACSLIGAVVLQVPAGKNYALKPVRFSGPCKSNLTVEMSGNIAASDDRSDYKEDNRHWLTFDGVDNLLVEGGGGKINGNGNIWWQNSCKINKTLALTFYKSRNLVVQNLNIQDAQQIHVSFEGCTDVRASGFTITAREKSDDCISIVSGSQHVTATNITCGPGHGISIGSLGAKNSMALVFNVTVDGAKLSGITNGVRIKTWQGGSGTASNITFQNIEMNNVTNPIIIDQNYCDQSNPCHEQSSAVQIKNVVYNNINGTSSSEVAINFNCSTNHPCQAIALQKVSLQNQEHGPAKAICNNVNLIKGDSDPKCPRVLYIELDTDTYTQKIASH
ncbi:Polygalacturonase [Hibiscus syriacus]|uniref:Polygalacturonase n=1 Tax=Hibiscus syriacus TaxID=106335 RepID=A0A6A2YRB8_HIBSY|nr:Polygalacturonase [Hibiscus syriacus]